MKKLLLTSLLVTLSFADGLQWCINTKLGISKTATPTVTQYKSIIDIECYGVGNVDNLTPLSNLTNATKIKLTHSNVKSNEGLQAVYNLPKLRTLDLSYNHMRVEMPKTLNTHIIELNLAGNTFSDGKFIGAGTFSCDSTEDDVSTPENEHQICLDDLVNTYKAGVDGSLLQGWIRRLGYKVSDSSKLPNLQVLNVSDSNYFNAIPKQVSKAFYGSNARIIGDINITKPLEYLRVSNNYLDNNITINTSKMKNGNGLSLYKNNLLIGEADKALINQKSSSLGGYDLAKANQKKALKFLQEAVIITYLTNDNEKAFLQFCYTYNRLREGSTKSVDTLMTEGLSWTKNCAIGDTSRLDVTLPIDTNTTGE